MVSNPRLARAVRIALITSAASASVVMTSAASAQDQDQASGSMTGTMTVTGSRIARQDYEATSPVVTLSDETLKLSGTPQIETVLNYLPQLVPSVTTTSNNPSNGGQANIDLRGLGTQRTLVLMDGVRLQPSNVTGVIDLNAIPSSMIEGIEILTGGASSTYGSDAIAGVVNIKTKRNFSGVELGAQTSLTGESDGRTNLFQLTMGGNFADDRGNVVVALEYDKRDDLLAGSREFGVVAYGPDLQPAGSTSVPEGRFVQTVANAPTQAAYDAVFGPGVTVGTPIGFNSANSVFSFAPVRLFTGDTTDPGFNPASFSYNYSPINYLQLPLERRQVAGFARYDMSERVEAYSRFMYTTYEADQQLASTPITGLTIPANHPLINSQLRTILNSRPNPNAEFSFEKRVTEVGPRTSDNNYDVMQGLVGARGDFEIGGQAWKWDVYGTWGRTERTELQGGNVSRSRLELALDSPTGLASRGCTNMDPFGANSISAACANAIAIKTSNITELEQVNYVGSFSGGLFNLPAGPLMTAIGAEYRENKANFRPDEFLASGDVVGFNAQQPVSGQNDVFEPFVEVSIPLLADLPFVDYLGLEAGYRNSNYDLGGSADTHKVALEWRPIETLKLRGSINHANRVPNLAELFTPAQEGFPSYRDPCWNGSAERTGPNAAQVNALCAATGAPANFPMGNSQVRAIQGGNINLLPEEADTMTFGFAWTPNFGAHRLRASVDYFDYEISKTIGVVGAATTVTRCYNDQGANPTYDAANFWCTRFSRPNGEARDVIANNSNLGQRLVDGVDIQVDYSLPLNLFGLEGKLRTNLIATKLLNWEFQEDPTSPLVDVTDTITINIAETYPEWKAVLNLGYSFGDWDVNWNVRYIDEMQVVNNDANRTNPLVGVNDVVEAYDYHRLTIGWNATESINFTLGIDNLFDKMPPIYTSDARAGVQSNTDPSTYDVLGRRFFLNALFSF